MASKQRCGWCLKDQLYQDYHDQEWGVPVYDDHKLFEMLNLEGAQAGLSWYTVLVKRENYRQAFDHWDAAKIARYDDLKVESLLLNPGIIRNRLKVKATVSNAQAFLAVCQQFGSFNQYIWQFVQHQPKINQRASLKDIPARTVESDAMSKDLLKRGFKFVGSTICYAFMQATGMVDDHVDNCWKRNA
ncbi:MAG: DNA-3-methyladenine glycosylase I [Bacteroidota bacterium]